MLVKSVPTKGWTRGDIEATIRLVTQEQRQALANRVRALMEDQNLDNVRLSRASGVSEKTISRIINAKLAPRYSTLERLSQGLGLSDNDLWNGIGGRTVSHQPNSDATPNPFPASASTDQLRAIKRQLATNNKRLATIEKQLEELVDHRREAQQQLRNFDVEDAREFLNYLQEVRARQGRDVGRRALQSRRAAGQTAGPG